MRSPVDRAVPWLAASAGYLATYFVSTAVPVRLVWHLPVERRFTYEVRPLALGADFYGRLLLCLAIGAVCFAAARLFLRVRTAHAPALRALLFWTFGLAGFTAGLYLYLLSSRQPIPAPLPAGYVAR